MPASSAVQSRHRVISLALLATLLTGCHPERPIASVAVNGAKQDAVLTFEQMPPEDPWYAPGEVQLGSAPAYVTDITAQDAAASTWANAFGTDTLSTNYQYLDCIAYSYYGARVSYNCPAGPCYTQWRNMRDAGMNFTGTVNGFLLAGHAVRNAWGLWALGLPSGLIITATWSALDVGHKQFLQCISEGDNWRFYNNDQPNPYRVPGMPR